MINTPISGLYAVTPEHLPTDVLIQRTEDILLGGAQVLQYRAKTKSLELKKDEAAHLLALCRRMGRHFIINDDLDLALELESDGLHLGRDDTSLARARKEFKGTIGLSCYASLERAADALRDGADYIAFGAMAASATKPQAPLCPLNILTEARRLRIPIVAIGGITLDNAEAILSAGADSLAVISALYDSESPRQASERFCNLWRSYSHEP